MWRWQLKLVEVVTVAHVDDEERVGWGYEVQSWSKCLSLRFADIWLKLWSWCLIKILKMFDQEITLVSRTQPSGPLCLWQCFIYLLVMNYSVACCQFSIITRRLGPKCFGNINITKNVRHYSHKIYLKLFRVFAMTPFRFVAIVTTSYFVIV